MKKLLFTVTALIMFIFLLPMHNAEAATKKSTLKSIKVSSKKVKSDTVYNNIMYHSSNDKYYMAIRETESGDIVLSYTTSGTKYTDIDLVDLVKEKFGKDISDISFYDLTCLDDIFYITGKYSSEDYEYKNFYITTSDGKKITGDDNLLNTIGGGFELGYLYKVGKTFIYTVDEGQVMGGGLTYQAAVYTSKDLKTWKEVLTPENNKGSALGQMWTLECITEKGMIITANKDVILEDDYYWYPEQLYYTTDFKTFKKIESGISYNDMGANVYSAFNNTTLYRMEKSWDKDDNFTGLKLLTSTNFIKWKTILNYKESEYSSPTKRFYRNSTDNKLFFAVEREKDNSLFIYSSKTKSFIEYSTSLKASLFGNGVKDKNDKYSYTIYNDKYILVSSDSYKTSYKFKAPIGDIRGLGILDGNLIILGENNYYIPIKSINSAIAASKK